MSKKYLNIMKNLKLDQIYAHDKLDVTNWSQWDPNKNKYLIDKKFIKKSLKLSKYYEKLETRSNLFTWWTD